MTYPVWVRGIDRLNGWLGQIAGVLTVLMILIGAVNAVVRYLGRWSGVQLSSNAYIELQWYLFSGVFLLGAAYTLSRNEHVRVDVLYSKLSPRGQGWIDLIGSLVFTLPFCLFMLWASWPAVRNSWSVREISPDPGGLARYPIKSLILLAFGLLFLQGIAEVGRSWTRIRNPHVDWAEHQDG